MVREGLLRKKTRELRREVRMMKLLEEASSHVRMLTQEIRRSLDRHMILHTTLVELSKVLFLHTILMRETADAKPRFTCSTQCPAERPSLGTRHDIRMPQHRQVSRNIDLVYGGGSIGLMGLVSQAVYDGGRHVIGVIPKRLCLER